MAGDISQFFGSIKSIQRGTISITGASTSQTATITAVDTTKTQLRVLGAAVTTNVNELPYVVLTNATTITATRTGGANTTVVSWELTENY